MSEVKISPRDAELFLSEAQSLTDRQPAADDSKEVKDEWVSAAQTLVRRPAVRPSLEVAGHPQHSSTVLMTLAVNG
jgi:hypothetical protein